MEVFLVLNGVEIDASVDEQERLMLDLAAGQRDRDELAGWLRPIHASIMLAREEFTMPTITVRNVPAKVVQSLKALAKRHNRSMEQEVRELLEGYVVERRAVLDQIETGWQKQARRPTAAEVDGWMAVGRA
jgi:death-on-curing protein